MVMDRTEAVACLGKTVCLLTKDKPTQAGLYV